MKPSSRAPIANVAHDQDAAVRTCSRYADRRHLLEQRVALCLTAAELPEEVRGEFDCRKRRPNAKTRRRMAKRRRKVCAGFNPMAATKNVSGALAKMHAKTDGNKIGKRAGQGNRGGRDSWRRKAKNRKKKRRF